MEAFELALRLGAQALESDVWVTADGWAVLDHDGLVGRRPRRRPISECLRSELPDHIPTLYDLYDLIGDRIDLSLDVKDVGAATATVACARAHTAESRLWLCHPERDVVSDWRLLSADVQLVESTRLAKLVGGPEIHVSRSTEAGINVINMHHSDWTGGLIATVHRFGLLAFGWDAQFDRILDELLDSGIDAVYSDHVDRMCAALSQI